MGNMQTHLAAQRLAQNQVQTAAAKPSQPSLPKFQVNGACFTEFEKEPKAVMLTMTYMVGPNAVQTLTAPFQLMTEASQRGISLTTEQLQYSSSVWFLVYRGLTKNSGPHSTQVNLVYVVKVKVSSVDTTYPLLVPINMAQSDVPWVAAQLNQTPSGGNVPDTDGTHLYNLRQRMGQQIGRPDAPTPYVEQAAIPGKDMHAAPNPMDPPSSSLVFHEPSRFTSDQIHYQQVARR